MHGTILSLTLLAMPTQSVFLPADLYLVRAMTVEVGRKEYPIPYAPGPTNPPLPFGTKLSYSQPVARQLITHVYLGPASLKGQDFRYEQGPSPFMGSGPQMARLDAWVEAPAKGIEGLWWIRSRQPTSDDKTALEADLRQEAVVANRIEAFPYLKRRIDTRLSYATLSRATSDAQRAEWLQKHAKALEELQAQSDARYRDGLAWAEAIEKVARAGTDAERARLLRGHALAKSPVGAWAIAWLGKRPEEAGFLREVLADPGLPLSSQLAIDGILLYLDGYLPDLKWVGSKERLALHQRWRELKKKPAAESGLGDHRTIVELDRLLGR